MLLLLERVDPKLTQQELEAELTLLLKVMIQQLHQRAVELEDTILIQVTAQIIIKVLTVAQVAVVHNHGNL